MKKLALIFGLTLVLAGCALGKLNSVDYNNRIVTQINETSVVIESSATLYNETIPDVVTEKTEISMTSMQEAYNAAANSLNQVSPLTRLGSKDYEQELAIQTELNRYNTAGTIYLSEYKIMLDYYKNQEYKEDVTRVSEIDTSLHTAYTTFIEANNDIVELLGTFVDGKELQDPATEAIEELEESTEETAEESV